MAGWQNPAPFDSQAYGGACVIWAITTLVISIIAQLAAPRRSYVVHTAVDARPWMMGLLGLGTVGTAVVLIGLAVLLFSGPVAVPLRGAFLVVIGLSAVGVLSLGHGAALEHFGAEVLRRCRRPTAGPIAARSTAVGLLFVLKLIPFVGFATIIFEGLLMLSGAGAAVHTGFGSVRGWLPARMRTHTLEAG
jgi:hypothetical protein